MDRGAEMTLSGVTPAEASVGAMNDTHSSNQWRQKKIKKILVNKLLGPNPIILGRYWGWRCGSWSSSGVASLVLTVRGRCLPNVKWPKMEQQDPGNPPPHVIDQ
jgi:hypothetical protein